MPGRRPPTHRRTISLLAPATFFEGYDALILGLALPLIREEFSLSLAAAGAVGSIVFAGSFGSLGLLALADRYGRRPVLTATIAGYTVATFLTAFSQGVVDFAILQFVARVFLGAERVLASIVVVETLPQDRRGRVLGLLSSMVAFGQASAGLGFFVVVATGASWRWLYLVGILPLVLVARARRDLPETLSVRPAEFRPPVRRKWVAGASALGFLFALLPTSLTVFASTLVMEDWGWDLTAINPAFFVVWALAVSGFFVAGRFMDAWGRRPTAAVFFFGAAVAALFAFRAATDLPRAMGLGAVIFFLTGAAPVMSAYTTEPFPERVRGRIGALVRVADIGGSSAAPGLTGLLAGPLGGIGPALSTVAVSYAVGAVTVWALLPETLGLEPGAALSDAG